jgi:hypothetical protein
LSFENRYRTHDGSYRWLVWTARSPEERLVFAAARDVTESKADRRSSVLRAKLELAERAQSDNAARLTQLVRELEVAKRRAEEATAAKDSSSPT